MMSNWNTLLIKMVNLCTMQAESLKNNQLYLTYIPVNWQIICYFYFLTPFKYENICHFQVHFQFRFVIAATSSVLNASEHYKKYYCKVYCNHLHGNLSRTKLPLHNFQFNDLFDRENIPRGVFFIPSSPKLWNSFAPMNFMLYLILVADFPLQQHFPKVIFHHI